MQGREGQRQFTPVKRTRYGIKMFTLCELKSAYVLSSMIYTGKGSVINTDKYFVKQIKKLLIKMFDIDTIKYNIYNYV